MATVVEFRAAARPRFVHRDAGSACEVVLFPGVRYERHADAPVPKRSRTARERDTLELAD